MIEEEAISAALQAAVEVTRRRIHRHQRRVSEDVNEILGVIGERLCDPSLDGEELKRICPPGSSTLRQFRLELGRKPVKYWDDRRYEMARHLVSWSGVPVAEIGKRVGFSEPELFTKWFKRRAGQAPKMVRAAAPSSHPGRSEQMWPPMAARSEDEWPPTEIWHKVLLGCANSQEAAWLRRLLRATYPAAACERPSRERAQPEYRHSPERAIYDVSEDVLLRAAEPTVRGIRQMEKHASSTLKAVLKEIRQHFFEAGFTLVELKKAVGVSDNWLLGAFRQEMGLTAWCFIRESRLEMAARLLRDTSLSVPDICLLVGYTSIATFRRLFRRWSSLRPAAYRQCSRRLRSQARGLLDDAITCTFRKRCRRGELSTDEARELIVYLETLAGSADPL